MSADHGPVAVESNVVISYDWATVGRGSSAKTNTKEEKINLFIVDGIIGDGPFLTDCLGWMQVRI